MNTVNLFCGDCLDVLPRLEAKSIESIVCDPPYGMSFLGKDWDHGVPGVPFWEAALRVAKPGAMLLAFGGDRTHHRLMVAIEDAGWEIRDCLMWLHGQGFPKGHSQLKPAWEPIILARKPLSEPTIAANVLRWGTGGINIDECRIGVRDDDPNHRENDVEHHEGVSWYGRGTQQFSAHGLSKQGRWPANLLLDSEVAVMLDEQSGERKTGGEMRRNGAHKSNSMAGELGPISVYTPSDTGGAARFFYVAKASKADREEGNDHPTVKPSSLMRELVRLVTPPGGVVLDHFMGSGSTGKAAVLEGFNFIGIDKDAHYLEIARSRINKALLQPSLLNNGALGES